MYSLWTTSINLQNTSENNNSTQHCIINKFEHKLLNLNIYDIRLSVQEHFQLTTLIFCDRY